MVLTEEGGGENGLVIYCNPSATKSDATMGGDDMSGPIKPGPPMIGGQPLSPVHYSRSAGVHADIGFGANKVHVPYSGQTTLQTFGIGGSPSYENDRNLARLGGTLLNKDIFNL